MLGRGHTEGQTDGWRAWRSGEGERGWRDEWYPLD